MRRPLLLALTAAALLALLAPPQGTFAGGPWQVMNDGTPLRWPGATPVPIFLDVDAGGLGVLNHSTAEARLSQALGAWNLVGPVTLTIDTLHPLPDVNASNYWNYWNKPNAVAGSAIKVIFDADGAIVSDMFGEGAADDILGLASIDTATTAGPNIEEVSILINGTVADGTNPLGADGILLAAMSHEIGHALNLGHSALNGNLAGDGDAANDRYIPAMFPLLTDNTAELAALKSDDTAAIKALYGGATPSVEGSVWFNGNRFQGAQVTVRRVDGPPDAPYDAFLSQAFSSVSGFQYIPIGGMPPAFLENLWRVQGLPAGHYKVCIEQIDTAFSFFNGSQVGPLAEPPVLPGPEECWDAAESGTASLDDPDTATILTVSGAVTGIDITLNSVPSDDPGDVVGNNTLPAATDLSPGPINTTRGLLGPSGPPGDRDFFKMNVSPGDRVRIDIDASDRRIAVFPPEDVYYGTDAIIGLWNGANSPVLQGGVQVTSDDALDPATGIFSRDPYLDFLVPAGFVSPLKIGVTCYPDTGFAGCVTATGRPYWLKVEVQHDQDGDGVVDSSDVCPADPFNDVDRDLLCVSAGDHCPRLSTTGSGNDADTDGIDDECDNCPFLYNPTQSNVDNDLLGDLCDSCTDSDSDGYGDPGFPANTCPADNCPSFKNPSQANLDGDAQGNPCDPCPSSASNACVDTTPPSVVFTFPDAGMTGVSTSSDILLIMSEEIDPESATPASIYLEGSSGKVQAAVRVGEGGVITLDPAGSLAPNTSYSLHARSPLRDRSGNEIASAFSSSFTTINRTDVVDSTAIGGTGAAGASGDNAGTSVTLLGDMNGDGFDDYAYGSPGADIAGPVLDVGKVTLVLGGSTALTPGTVTKIEFRGSVAGQAVGGQVADAGDLDGDGLHDIAFSSPQPASGMGKVWVVFGDTGWSTFAAGSTTIVSLGGPTLANCARPPTPGGDYFCGTVFQAASADKPGVSISRTADIGSPSPPPFHDGIGELLIGAPGTDFAGRTDAGAAYLIYGRSALRAQTYTLPTDTGTATLPGVIFKGENAFDAAGHSVSLWTDPELGGVDDLVIGAPLADTLARDGITTLTDAGYVYVIHPNATLAASTELAWVGKPSAPTVSGFVLIGAAANEQLGISTSGASDVDGDGVMDVFVAANGSVYALSGDEGKQTTTDGSSTSRDDVGGSPTQRLRQIGTHDVFHNLSATHFYQTEAPPLRSMVVSGSPDLNGDGFGDLIIGDPHADGDIGRVYVVYGRPSGWPEEVSMLDIGVTVPGLCINCSQGQQPSLELAGLLRLFGFSAGGGRDVNGDCLGDAIVGAPGGGNGNVFLFDTVPAPSSPSHLDADGDTYDACEDCNDMNPLVHPTLAEVCDGFDNNCNGVVDDIPGAPDADGDGRNNCIDCNDNLPSVYPGHPEACDGFDNDCNGIVDDTGDVDGDGFSTCTDCNDASFAIHPGQHEACDGIDNDCDGSTDEDYTNLNSACTAGVGQCQASGVFVCATGGGSTQCNAVPGSPAPEACDGLDNDCDGSTDEDGDGDGVGICADCNDLLVGSYATPGEVLNLRFTSSTALAWDAPASPGGASIRYDTIRAGSPTGFVAAGVCAETDDGSNTQATDAATPALGAIFYYLIRAENDCVPGQGPLGFATNGTPRSARNCP